MKENIDILLEIIRKNNLEVVDTEQEVNCKIGLLTGTELDPPIKGFVDMLLKTKDGDNVVFDFKWTSSKTKHKKLLEENASIQLALYDEIITRITKKPVVATAYFTMPWHKLYTTSPTLVSMHNVEHVEPSNNDDLLKKIINSYRYRRAELMKGTIGTAKGFKLDENIAYVANTETQGLVPLTEYDKNHSVNKYSNFKCFKGKLK